MCTAVYTIPMPTPSKQVGVPGTDDLQWDVTVALCIVDLLSQIQGSQLGKKVTQISKDNGLAIEQHHLDKNYDVTQ